MHPDSAALSSRRDRNLVRRTSSATKEPKRLSIGAFCAFERSPGSSGPLARTSLNPRSCRLSVVRGTRQPRCGGRISPAGAPGAASGCATGPGAAGDSGQRPAPSSAWPPPSWPPGCLDRGAIGPSPMGGGAAMAAARRSITPIAGLEDGPHPGKKAVPRGLARHGWNRPRRTEEPGTARPRARSVRAGRPHADGVVGDVGGDGGELVLHGLAARCAAPVRSRRRPSGSDRWRRDGQLRGTWPAPMPSA